MKTGELVAVLGAVLILFAAAMGLGRCHRQPAQERAWEPVPIPAVTLPAPGPAPTSVADPPDVEPAVTPSVTSKRRAGERRSWSCGYARARADWRPSEANRRAALAECRGLEWVFTAR